MTNLEPIIRAACEVFEVPRESLKGLRTQASVSVRRTVAHIGRQEGYSYTEIAKALGCCETSRAIRIIPDRQEVRRDAAAVKGRLKGGDALIPGSGRAITLEKFIEKCRPIYGIFGDLVAYEPEGGWTYDEIVSISGLSESEVRRTERSALTKLAEWLGEDFMSEWDEAHGRAT